MAAIAYPLVVLALGAAAFVAWMRTPDPEPNYLPEPRERPSAEIVEFPRDR